MAKVSSEKGVFPFDSGKHELKVFRTAIECTPDPMVITDVDGRHLYHNLSFTQLFGYSCEELNKSYHEILFADPGDSIKIANILDAGSRMTLRLKTKDKAGREIDVELLIEVVKDDDRIISFIWIFEDVTEQKKIRKELRFQQEYLSTIHTISLGMFRRLKLSDLLRAIISRASKITRIPDGFICLYDSSQRLLEVKVACGKLVSHVGLKIKPGDGLSGKVFETGEPMIINDYQAWPKKINSRPLKNVCSIICIPLISGSKIEGVIGLSHHTKLMHIEPETIIVLEQFSAIAQIAIDSAKLFENQKNEFNKRLVSENERKQMEAQLFQAQRMESIGTLAGGIAHDFNNILSSIIGFAQIAMGDVEKGSQTADDLNEIYLASLRARDLVQQILTFARQSDDKLNVVKVSLIAKEVLKFIRSSIPTTIEIRQNIVSTGKVMASPTQLYQVFLNLYTNAAQAMADNDGLLEVDMHDEELTGEDGPLPCGNYIKIRVSDTGVGIEKDNIDKIFEPYFTTKDVGEGTGLGLSVVHGAVKTMKGDIRVNSTIGEGTSFTLFLPMSKEKEKQFTHNDRQMPMGKKENILFVDDEVAIAKVGKRILESLNYKVTTLTDSLEALELFRSKPGQFQAVVTDWTMPKMTGDKLAIEIKKINPDIPILLCTGLDKEIAHEELSQSGLDYFYKKPISKHELAAALQKALKK
ncbi:MAG: ATP-binding protein [Desulfobacula sp.]|nr:ATP-binding protein [Desulfobacula sp.]